MNDEGVVLRVLYDDKAGLVERGRKFVPNALIRYELEALRTEANGQPAFLVWRKRKTKHDWVTNLRGFTVSLRQWLADQRGETERSTR